MSQSETERAAHWREFFSGTYLNWTDLKGKDATVVISAYEYKAVTMPGGAKEKKLILSFDGKEKKMILNKTNAKAIAALHSGKVDNWIKKPITIYPDENVRFGSEKVGGIRVRKKTK